MLMGPFCWNRPRPMLKQRAFLTYTFVQIIPDIMKSMDSSILVQAIIHGETVLAYMLQSYRRIYGI